MKIFVDGCHSPVYRCHTPKFMKRITVAVPTDIETKLAELAKTNRRGVGPQIAFMLEQHFFVPRKARKAKTKTAA